MIDENAEKQRRTEFVGVLAPMLPQLSQMIAAEPKTAEFCGEILKFATAPFRAGREPRRRDRRADRADEG